MLHLAVEWLAGSYHGREWPPSPLRVTQALLAGARRFPSVEYDFDAALRELENLPPPDIYAPKPTIASPVRVAVPNNDSDRVAALHARGDTSGARKLDAKLRTLRERAGRFVEGPVHYLWAGEPSPTWDALADRLTCVGQGIDLAWARVSQEEPLGVLYEPNENGEPLQVPYPGGLDALESRYNDFRASVGRNEVAGVREPRHITCCYRSPNTLPRRRSAAFLLRTLDDKPWSTDRDGSLAVAAMVRHAIHEAAKRAGMDENAITELMGHGGDGRINAMPAPNAGHLWADGRVRRVLVTGSAAVTDLHWNTIVLRLTGAELQPLGAQPEVMLVPAPRDDNVARAFMGPSSAWTTVSPVVLPGFDQRRGKPRPKRTARRLLQHAGIPEAAVTEIVFEPMGRLAGTSRAQDYPVPKHLAKFPLTHLTIRFNDRVTGPLYLGAGVGVGLGLLVPCER